MPLLNGSGKRVISHNIGEMVKAGHPTNVAVAAAYHKAGKSKLTGKNGAKHFRKKAS